MPEITKWISTLLLPTSAAALGRLVADVRNPNESYQDTSRSEEIPDGPKPAFLDAEAENVQYDKIGAKGLNFSTAITAIFSSTLKIKKSDMSKIIADGMTTRKLSNSSQYFQKACQNKTVRGWLERR
ncbi:hypothetical protein F5Y10DRAFT_290929 [Nemania abortiva]|nr:hypothetical protein F5Y10DRAFT_290929 [Nemania abortiva]